MSPTIALRLDASFTWYRRSSAIGEQTGTQMQILGGGFFVVLLPKTKFRLIPQMHQMHATLKHRSTCREEQLAGQALTMKTSQNPSRYL